MHVAMLNAPVLLVCLATVYHGSLRCALGIYIVCSKSMKYSLDECKKKFYRAANGIFGKIGRSLLLPKM